jgi:hypothetical protein
VEAKVVWGFTYVAGDADEALELARVQGMSNTNVPAELISAIACALQVMPQGKRIRVYAFSGRPPDGAVLNVSTV